MKLFEEFEEAGLQYAMDVAVMPTSDPAAIALLAVMKPYAPPKKLPNKMSREERRRAKLKLLTNEQLVEAYAKEASLGVEIGKGEDLPLFRAEAEIRINQPC